MFENTDKIDLAKVEKILDRSFGKVGLLGELRFTLDDYRRVARAVKEALNKNPENLEKIPERVFLALLVFCARYEDTYTSGYWPVFLQRLGLRNDAGVQNACRKRFKEARGNLEHLYFPAEGYKYVTPILYHAVIPQADIDFKCILPRQPAQALPDLRKARLALLRPLRWRTHLDLYARERGGAQDQPPWGRDLHSR